MVHADGVIADDLKEDSKWTPQAHRQSPCRGAEIIVETLPLRDVGMAIMARLRRASYC
jgi:hypothetical protein